MAGTENASPSSLAIVDDSKVYVRRQNCNSSQSNLKYQDGKVTFSPKEYSFTLLDPKDVDSQSKYLLQEVLNLYMEELPTMNYAANTGKKSQFLEKCIFSGKYRTLLLRSDPSKKNKEVVAAVSYQIIPNDTQYAEIPLAAVSVKNQKMGVGQALYKELRERLQNVGIINIFCWADKTSEGFWLKQGFVALGEVDRKGKVRKLPIKADIRRALSFPGGSMLMVAHANKDTSTVNSSQHIKPFSSSSTKLSIYHGS
ncbi:hypothetical protein Cni_G04729 [Canna indica]|uniref:N-acetyltransferase domain-containing protein n=1 Tax=Canna indica TaxID=4628 RepID=A0AAQ3Q4R5_9LILI|nr:hypothetical protein Cni_G04729 [Canna indica]